MRSTHITNTSTHTDTRTHTPTHEHAKGKKREKEWKNYQNIVIINSITITPEKRQNR